MSYQSAIYPEDPKEYYEFLNMQAVGLTMDVPHFVANLSNLSALLNDALENINWVGFYLMQDGKLVLGPFQGKPACIEIAVGKGVCGTAAAKDELQLVEDVHQFPGHIACDGASNSEIVIPMHVDGQIVGVLDIDSPNVGRFSKEDAEGLLMIVRSIEGMEWFIRAFS